jgi:fatty acid desaturase
VPDSAEPPEPPAPDKAPAGWYTDPLGIGKHRYWDGESWTEQTVRPNPMTNARSGAEIVIGISGIALAVSPFLVWAHIILFGDYNLFQLLNAEGASRALAWILLIGGVIAAVFAFFIRVSTRAVALGVGILVGIFALVKAINLTHEVNAAKIEGAASVGYGPWVAVVACVVMIVGGVMVSRSPADDNKLPPKL